MASVLNYIECPNCKHEASDDFYYKTGEEYINCGNCGYHRSATIINRDKKLSELTEEDWEIKELKDPYGAYRLKVYHGVATQCGSLENKEQYNEFKSQLEGDVEFCSVSRFVNGEIKFEMIIDNGPEVDSSGFKIEDR